MMNSNKNGHATIYCENQKTIVLATIHVYRRCPKHVDIICFFSTKGNTKQNNKVEAYLVGPKCR